MVKKSTPAEKAARMLDLVPFISSHQGISFKELADEFGISESELSSDLNALWMCGDNRFDLIELEFESGYVSIRNAETLNMVRSLSSQEIVSLLIGLDIIAKDLPSERTDLIETIEVLKSKLGRGLEQSVDAAPPSSHKFLTLIEKALVNSQKISVDYYTAAEDRLSTRTLVPLEIYQSEGRNFLHAFCELTQSHRTFRIDRIRDAKALEENPSKSIPAKIPSSTTIAKLTIRDNFRKSYETLGVKSTTSTSEVSIETFSPAWLTRTVISAGGSIVLNEPESVRSEIAAKAKSALALYD